MLQLIKKPWMLVLISALFFYISWPPLPYPWLIFVAFSPLLYLYEKYYHGVTGQRGYLVKVYVAFLLWNVADTWWVYLASPMAIFAMTLNSLFMMIPFWGFAKMRRQFNYIVSGLSLIAFWLTFEYIHMQWDITWPWLTLGNVFANSPGVVQWYEITGTSGGTLWVWLVNIFITSLWLQWNPSNLSDQKYLWRKSAVVDILILVPMIISGILDINYNEQGTSTRVMLVQPNLDPYTEKFNGLPAKDQLRLMLGMAEKRMDSSVKLLVLPETALTETMDESEIHYHQEVRMIQEFISRHPGICVLTGAVTYRNFNQVEAPTQTARKVAENLYMDYYNTALLLDTAGDISIYHKSKLVPGVEKMPFPAFFKFLERFSIDNGGIAGSLGTDSLPLVLGKQQLRVAPVICYESIYGDYVRQYIKRGANLITIITNDGWWGNTDGYKQHLQYGTLRAIETRTAIARCANTGISGFVDQKGRLYQTGQWWQPQVLVGNVYLHQGDTFFVRVGDWISPLALLSTIVVLCLTLGQWIKGKIK